jgi:two-component system nitrate/nitrite response regulator NarL
MGINKKSLIVVDDHDMFREMLVHLFTGQKEIEIIGTVGTISEAERIVGEKCPDLILLDLMMPDGSGIEWARTVRRDMPNVKILVVTASDSKDAVVDAINIGAEGYVMKSSSSERLLEAVKAVLFGDYIYYPSFVLSSLRHTGRSQHSVIPDGDGVIQSLSNREKQIAVMVSQGLTYIEIADEIGVSVNTVKTHVQRIYKRLGVSSRRELAKRFFS